MRISRPLAGLVLLAALTSPVSAVTLSFLVVESGFSGDPTALPAGSFESSSLWENSLLDIFFEAGHIVSNSPILRLPAMSAKDFPGKESPAKEFPPELRLELNDAIEGGADYFILALLTFPPGAATQDIRPERVSLRVYATRPYRFVYEGNGAFPPNEEGERIKGLIRGLIPHLKD
jgi:hypothetical protein